MRMGRWSGHCFFKACDPLTYFPPASAKYVCLQRVADSVGSPEGKPSCDGLCRRWRHCCLQNCSLLRTSHFFRQCKNAAHNLAVLFLHFCCIFLLKDALDEGRWTIIFIAVSLLYSCVMHPCLYANPDLL